MMSSTRFRNSGRKCVTQRAQHRRLDFGPIRRSAFEDDLAPDVRRHDDDGVAEVDRAALRIRQPAVVEDLEQDVEDVGVRLLDLVEQDHRVRPPPNGFRELTALLESDVARRRADETRDGVLLHVLRHVDAHHRVLVVEQELGQRARGLRLSHAGRPEEDERPDRPVRILKSRARAPHGVGHRFARPRAAR